MLLITSTSPDTKLIALVPIISLQ